MLANDGHALILGRVNILGRVDRLDKRSEGVPANSLHAPIFDSVDCLGKLCERVIANRKARRWLAPVASSTIYQLK